MKWNLEWLRTLKAYTGYKLFDRSARKMVPTEKGKMFYNFVFDPLKKLEQGEPLFHKRSEHVRTTISLGMCFETFQYTLEEHINQLPFNLIIKFGEYPQMQQDLDSGFLDLIVTPQKGSQQNLHYQAFSKERIILIAGSKTNTVELAEFLKKGKIREVKEMLKQQLWYSTIADIEHLKNFWMTQFGEHPDFSPNYIVPNISSIIRCLSDSTGFSIVPDFLCSESINEGKIKLIWEGEKPLENILYFGTRKKTMYTKEIERLQSLFIEKWNSE